MPALTVQLVAAKNRALDGGCGELDALALGGEVGRGNAELDLVQPEVAVFAVGNFLNQYSRLTYTHCFLDGGRICLKKDRSTAY